jgi:hypothetical protein
VELASVKRHHKLLLDRNFRLQQEKQRAEACAEELRSEAKQLRDEVDALRDELVWARSAGASNEFRSRTSMSSSSSAEGAYDKLGESEVSHGAQGGGKHVQLITQGIGTEWGSSGTPWLISFDSSGQHTLSWDMTLRLGHDRKLEGGTANLYHFPAVKYSTQKFEDAIELGFGLAVLQQMMLALARETQFFNGRGATVSSLLAPASSYQLIPLLVIQVDAYYMVGGGVVRCVGAESIGHAALLPHHTFACWCPPWGHCVGSHSVGSHSVFSPSR